jgi:hypothetical protein
MSNGGRHHLGSAVGGVGAGSRAADSRCAPTTVTFAFTGGSEAFTVPAGVTQVVVDAFGAQGGGASGGLGGRATATVPVTPGEVLQVNVGEQGGTGSISAALAEPAEAEEGAASVAVVAALALSAPVAAAVVGRAWVRPASCSRRACGPVMGW